VSRSTTGRTKSPIEKPLTIEKAKRPTMQQVAAVVAPVLGLEQRTCRAHSAIAATSMTARSSSTTHQPLTANSVWDAELHVGAPPGVNWQLSPE
jgi:hypothetical protein